MRPAPLPAEAEILITGANGFIGRNLACTLRGAGYTRLLCFDRENTAEELADYCARAAFVFHLAGVNRPQDPQEFYSGNSGLTGQLCSLLAAAGNRCPLLMTSSVQAGNGSDYGKSKALAEEALAAHARATGAPVYLTRMPGVFGKWCRPNYNSVVATFCHNAARGLPLSVRDEAFSLPLIYIDDLAGCLLQLLQGGADVTPGPDGLFRFEAGPVFTTTLGALAETIESFKKSRENLQPPDQANPLVRRLYSTYLSYLEPTAGFKYPLCPHRDARGSFTEFLRSPERGQVSINVSRPGIVKGNHWHHSKNEKFLVVSGKARIRFRQVGGDVIYDYLVDGDTPEVVDIPTGYTHLIENVGETDLVTVMWANECFDPGHPDTWPLPVEE